VSRWLWIGGLAAAVAFGAGITGLTEEAMRRIVDIAGFNPERLALGKGAYAVLGAATCALVWPMARLLSTAGAPASNEAARGERRWLAVGVLSACGTLATALFVSTLLVAQPLLLTTDLYRCANAIRPALVQPGLILASGSICRDRHGLPYAPNTPYMFYWLGRRGFNICREDQTVENVATIAARGARYFVAERESMDGSPGFEVAMKHAYPVVAACPAVEVFELRSDGAKAPVGAATITNGR
jgi:hypothetical protein